MATSPVDIMNSALIKLGAERIISEDDSSTRARLCKERYPSVRDALLRSHPWNFAMAYSQLAEVTPKPDDVFDYERVFQLPPDCLRVISTNLPVDVRWEEIENGRIAADTAEIYVKFVRKISDVTKFDANFVEVLALALAADIAYSLTQSTAQREEARESLRKELATARSYDAQVGSVRRVISDDWLDTRRRG